MKINEEGLKIIKDYEGLRLEAYKPVPSEKEFTIGYGHYGVPAGTVWTKKQAEEQLVKDLEKFEKIVEGLGRKFNENEFSALTSFCFNLGAANLKTLCRDRNNKQIAEAILKYNKANGQVLNGLTRRRKAEKELFLKPVKENAKEEVKEEIEKLPFKVKAVTNLTVRNGAGSDFKRIRTVKKGTVLTVWAIETNGNVKWGKNGKEYFCLKYCEKT